MNAHPCGSVNCSFLICAVTSANQKAQTASALYTTRYLLYTKKRVKYVSAIPSLKLYLPFFYLKMFPCSEYRRMKWNWVGCVLQIKGLLREMDYLNGIIPEDPYCQRFSCAISLFLAERSYPG